MRALGLDVGSRTIGLALSDPGGVIASPLEVLERAGHVADAKAIMERIARDSVQCLVVGLPLELDGSEGHRARQVRRFIAALEAQAEAIPIHTWDERYSTAAAERSLLDADLSRKKRRAKIDAVAAQHILQGWLDSRRPSDEGAEVIP